MTISREMTMDVETKEKLLALNHEFYDRLADTFAESRANPQPGFLTLTEYLPQGSLRLLDVGCGEGTLGRFLMNGGETVSRIAAYVGVDFSEMLLAKARDVVPGRYYVRDLSRPDGLEGLGTFDVVACLAVLQHIPGREARVQLLRGIGDRLQPQGRVFLSTWQFLDSERQRRKILPWTRAGLDEGKVEANDYLLSWRRGGFGLRYVAFIDEIELGSIVEAAGLRIVQLFRRDGKEGNLNLYAVLERDEE